MVSVVQPGCPSVGSEFCRGQGGGEPSLRPGKVFRAPALGLFMISATLAVVASGQRELIGNRQDHDRGQVAERDATTDLMWAKSAGPTIRTRLYRACYRVGDVRYPMFSQGFQCTES